MRTNSNPYCQKLDIAVPRVEDAMRRPGVKLFHLMVVTLLEQGQPVELRDIAARLDAAGAESPIGDLELSLKKAWHGLQPVYPLPDGRYGLVLGSFELEHILRAVRLRDDSTPVDLRDVQAVRPAVGVVVEDSMARRKRAARVDPHRPRSGQQHSGRRQKSDRPVKPRWIFAARFGHRLGWRSQPAVQRVREAVSEIVKEARRDPTRAADGAVLFFEKVAPALEHVDGSSGRDRDGGQPCRRCARTDHRTRAAPPRDPRRHAGTTVDGDLRGWNAVPRTARRLVGRALL